jgi:ribosomal protein S12 methylthiotransferase
MPTSAIRTTFIVGFPGETEDEFQSLLEFCREARLDRVGAFMFSREPGTPSYEMENQVPFRQKKARYDRLMSTQQKISMAINQGWVGKEIEILVESSQEGTVVGRSFRDAPEIDGLVYANSSSRPGEFQRVRVERAEPYDLIGKLVEPALAGARG